MELLTHDTILKLKKKDYFVVKSKKSNKVIEIWEALENEVMIIYPKRYNFTTYKISTNWNFCEYDFYKITEQEAKDLLFVESL